MTNFIVPILGISALSLFAFCYFIFTFLFVYALLFGAPYVPIPKYGLDKMIEYANVKFGQKAVDLGSGDGRIMIALAKVGAVVHGYEINPLLVLWTKWKIKKEGLEGRAFVHLKSFWDTDLSSFDIVTLFGVRKIMGRLEEKLNKELKPGAKIISFGFSFYGWEYLKKEQATFLYEKK
ncbi:MAG: class I SAM-dependent methyltransferase [bacterium]|nr:class I SAM-dependent methyltransferase [bacterium]